MYLRKDEIAFLKRVLSEYEPKSSNEREIRDSILYKLERVSPRVKKIVQKLEEIDIKTNL